MTTPFSDWADPLTPEEFRLLAEVGFVAAGRGQLEQASKIFNALIEIDPGKTSPHIGLALALLNRGLSEDALHALERAASVLRSVRQSASILENPDSCDDSALLQAFYGVALKLSGRTSESSRILRALSHRPAADHAGRIARSMLGMTPSQEESP